MMFTLTETHPLGCFAEGKWCLQIYSPVPQLTFVVADASFILIYKVKNPFGSKSSPSGPII